MAEARVMYGSQGGSLLYGGGSFLNGGGSFLYGGRGFPPSPKPQGQDTSVQTLLNRTEQNKAP